MAEVFQGTLSFKGEGKNERRFLSYTSKKGKPMSEPIGPDKLAHSLKGNREAEVPVAFELDQSGRPFRLRPSGEAWVEIPERKAPRDTPHETQGRGQRKRSADFHNPYNFIPAPPRPKTGTDLDDYGDDKQTGHDRYCPDRWSGRITVKLTTRTPLLIPDTARVTIERDHKSFSARVDSEGNPYLAPTSIKGMLRAAYEAITNSRMCVFQAHQDRLAYRMAAKIGPVPARVERRNGILGLRIMKADVMGFAARLPRYENGRRLPRDKGQSRAALRFSNHDVPVHDVPVHDVPVHGEAVWAEIDRGRCFRIERRTESDPPVGNWLAGWACVTGPNINRKLYERVFLEGPKDPFIPITKKHEKLWHELIENYQDTHKRDLKKREGAKGGPIPPDAYLGDRPGETGWSRHVHDEKAKDLREETLCYVEFGASAEVTALIPVTISRRLYESSPDALLNDSLKPALSHDELSPADRVFGWVNQRGKGALRGNLRVGTVTCTSSDPIMPFSQSGVPLAILGQPKPQQGRFYVADSPRGEAQEDGTSREQAGYWPHKGLRGRKVYPHHAGLPDDYWGNPEDDRTQRSNEGFFQEYRRPRKAILENGLARLDSSGIGFDLEPTEEQRDDQNRSITSWIKSNTDFVFDITVTNLSRVELGALLWLLELPSDHYHRLGGGKPLGFGSVSLAIDWDSSDLREGKAIRERYLSFDDVSNDDPKAAQTCSDDFKNAVARSYGSGDFERVSFITAFRKYAQGFNKPIHYPRALQPGQNHKSTIPPHPEGKAFEWFVANERTGREGGPKLSLPDIVSNDGLPILKR